MADVPLRDAAQALLTDEELAELRRLHEAATPVPWRTHDTWLDLGGYTEVVIRSDKTVPWSVAWLPTRSGVPLDDKFNCAGDAALIAATRNALPHLLDEVARLRAALAAADTRHDSAEAIVRQLAAAKINAATTVDLTEARDAARRWAAADGTTPTQPDEVSEGDDRER